MKKHYYFLVLFLITTTVAYEQANTALSNLTSPTSVNQSLLPVNNNVQNLGSTSKSWKTLYVDNNIFLKDSLFIHNNGTQNTFIGLQSGNAITTGSYNTAGGYKSLYSNTSGNYNTANGRLSLYSNTTGVQNTAYGESSLYSNTSGNVNLAIGQSSLYRNTTGKFNSGLGFETLFNSNGSYNTASGAYAMFNNSTGNNNVVNGYNAGRNSTSGNNNIFVGWQSGFNNTTGSNNVYIGYNAGGSASIFNSVAIGANVSVIKDNTIILGTDPNQQVGIGSNNPSAKLYVISQNQTTATYSASNAASGYGVFGQANAVGATGVLGEADNGTVAFGVWGKSASGNGVVGQGNNYGVWGISSEPGYAGYFTGNVNVTGIISSASDQKLKENIKPLDRILDKIMLLKPSLYNFKKEYNTMNLPQGEQIGFIAQDLEKVFPQLVRTITDIQPNKKKQSEYKGVNYISLIPVLTKAIQEQQEEISELKKQVNSLIANKGESDNSSIGKIVVKNNIYLGQNTPNPSINSTTIQYDISTNFKSAFLMLSNSNGIVIKQIKLEGIGKGIVEINTSALGSGSYNYSLMLDGNIVDTKRMIVSK